MPWGSFSEVTCYVRTFLLAPETAFALEPPREQPSRQALPLGRTFAEGAAAVVASLRPALQLLVIPSLSVIAKSE